jgi:hypothetical protein
VSHPAAARESVASGSLSKSSAILAVSAAPEASPDRWSSCCSPVAGMEDGMRFYLLVAISIAVSFSLACGSNENGDTGDASADAMRPPPDAQSSRDTGPCSPRTCAAQGIQCGPAGDGCGGLLQCGSCSSPETCGGGGKSSVCGEGSDCTPKTCAELGFNCGPAGDGCGGELECGTCTAPETCGGGGASVCGGGHGTDGGAPTEGGTGAATAILCPNGGQTGNTAICEQPPVLTFGKQGTSTVSAPLTISVNNCSTPNVPGCTGSGTLTLGSPYFTITGANASDFSNTGLGTCSGGRALASGSSCTLVLTFTPAQAAGTNETATLTVNDDGASAQQTMTLTGTSATVSLISSCQSLSSDTNYQLTANVSAPGTCFTVGGNNTDINLNGFTVTYCSASSSSYVGGVFMDGSMTTNTTVHNGSVNEGAGTCSGVTPSNGYGAGAIVASSDGESSASVGTAVFNVVSAIKANRAKFLFEENAGASTSSGTVVHDVIYTDNDTGSCASVGCRDVDQYYPIVVDQSGRAAPTQIYNVAGTGSPQGAMVTAAANSSFQYNLVDPGTMKSTVTNGFAFQAWGTGATIGPNLVAGTGTDGSCVSCRGVQVSSVDNVNVSGTVVRDNTIFTTELDNDAEYPDCASDQIASSYGMQLNTAGASTILTNNTYKNNHVTVTSLGCSGFGFSYSGANGTGNQTQGNKLSCTLASGHAPGIVCAGFRFDANQYSPHPDYGLTSVGDTITGDTSALYIWYDGSPSWSCSQCTLGKGSNPISGWVMLDYYGGNSVGQSSDPFFLIDPTFTGGATKDSNNLAAWASNNPSLTFAYTIQWTYSVTVKGASSGDAISGATVTGTNSASTEECNGTTNASGVFSCVVNDTTYAASGGKYTTTSFNPFTFKVSASGCSATTYSESVVSTTSETKTLPGC